MTESSLKEARELWNDCEHTRVSAAEAPCENCIATALEKAEERGRVRGIEESAKVAENYCYNEKFTYSTNNERKEIAQAIRQLSTTKENSGA